MNADTFESLFQRFRDGMKGDFVAPIEASRFVAEMRSKHPVVLAEWMDAHAERIVAQMLVGHLNAERKRLVRQAERFPIDIEGQEAFARSLFDQAYVVDDEFLRRPLRDMTGDDHRFVAAAYHSDGTRALALAAFHEAVARKVGRKTTGEVFTEDRYAQMLASFTTKNDPNQAQLKVA